MRAFAAVEGLKCSTMTGAELVFHVKQGRWGVSTCTGVCSGVVACYVAVQMDLSIPGAMVRAWSAQAERHRTRC